MMTTAQSIYDAYMGWGQASAALVQLRGGRRFDKSPDGVQLSLRGHREWLVWRNPTRLRQRLRRFFKNLVAVFNARQKHGKQLLGRSQARNQACNDGIKIGDVGCHSKNPLCSATAMSAACDVWMAAQRKAMSDVEAA